MNVISSMWLRVTDVLDSIGDWIAPLVLRVLVGWEFFEAGLKKYSGDNWFGSIQSNFPFPFNVVPPDVSWWMATWFELVGGALLILGLFTRFWAASLIILTVVATLAVHWGVGDVWSGDIRGYESFGEVLKGYVITNKGFGNYKLPLILLIMLVPLMLTGPGKASLDHFIRRRVIGA
ncbi:MAG: DoxX family protein [Gammaproteobacteria bacterium]|nr:MAG: DoxX family protein [Gammaproteobacteria bacterium]